MQVLTMTNATKIFGLTREEITIAGLPMQKRESLKPSERAWFQANSEKARNEWNEAYLAFVAAVKDKLKLKTEEESYHTVKEYFRGELTSEIADRIELLSIANPLKRDKDIDEMELTYFLNSRLVADKFPKEEFLEAFGIAYNGEWTKEHTEAASEIRTELEEFFTKEAAGKQKPEPEATTGK
jgi:hypothetical protein